MSVELKNRRLAREHNDLEVYQLAFKAAMKIFQVSKGFPIEERYSLTDQIRRSSRSVCANIAEAWRKRRYDAAFLKALGTSEAEAAETQTWIEFAQSCGYIDNDLAQEFYEEYDHMIAMLVQMIRNPDAWKLT